MNNSDNNSHTMFAVPSGDEMGDQDFETYRLSDLYTALGEGDFEGTMDVTIIMSGDCLTIPVTYHITSDGLVDIEINFDI